MKMNPDRRVQPDEAEMKARIEWFEQSRKDADRMNAESQLAQQQQREYEFREKLISDTLLSLPQLIAIREFLFHNPRPEADHNEEIR